MKLFVLIVLLIGTLGDCRFCVAQDTLTNKNIVELKKAGFGSDLIKTTIAASPCKFQTDARSIISLKKDGVEESVITEMIKKGSSTASLPTVQHERNSESIFIAQIKEAGSGIYYFDQDNTLQALEPAVFSEVKGKAFLSVAVSGIFNSKSVASLSGTKANVQIKTKTPRFYFYFSPERNNLNDQNSWLATATSPNEFVIVKFTIWKGNRDITLAKQNNVSTSGGIDRKSQQEFDFKKLENGLYEVHFSNPLTAGEYGIMYAALQQQRKVYDFGIKPINQ